MARPSPAIPLRLLTILPMAFVHLRSHSEYSVVDGTLRIDDLVKAAAKDGQPAVAVTDLSNLFGAVKLYSGARKKGVQPIIGADVWLEPEEGAKAPTRLLLLIQNRQGYLRLCELLGEAWTAPGQRTHAWVFWQSLVANNDGLICLSGADLGPVGQALLMGDAGKAEAWARKLAEAFPGRFYIELQRGGHATNEPHIRGVVPLAAKLQLPVVATHPIQFLEPDDFEAHEARVCVAEGETLGNPKRIKRFTKEQHFKTAAQMEALFADIPSAIANTVAIAQRCSLTLVLGKPQLPDFPTPIMPNGQPQPMEDYFRELSHQGLEERLLHLFPDAAQRDAERPRYGFYCGSDRSIGYGTILSKRVERGQVISSPTTDVGGGTLPTGNPQKVFLNFRNNLIMITKNMPLQQLIWKLPLRIALDAVSAWKELLSGKPGYWWAVVRAHFAFTAWVFTGTRTAAAGYPILQGVYPGSVVWKYFIQKKQIFSEIVKPV